jgi:nickel superoxide dismutase
MKIKSILFLALLTCLSGISAFGHCQVPCGIYADQHRFEQMLEDQATIEKAGKLIAELSGKKDALSHNQLSRWVATKEAHATNIQKVIAEYFMAQRIKATAKNYEAQLVSAHSVIVAAMKCKQNVDGDSAANLKKAIMALHKAYEGKK